MRFAPNTKGLIQADVSAYLRSEVTGGKLGDYIEDSAAEENQSGKFEVEYRERYIGDLNNYALEGNTWYYVYAIRSKEQGSNLWEYVFTGTKEGKFFNEFAIPVYVVGTPFDMQFWWPANYTDLSAVIKQYDSGNNELASDTIVLNNAAKGKLCSVKIDQDTIEELTSYINIEIIEP